MTIPVKSRQRLSLFIDELATGGAQRVFVFLSQELAKRGHDVDLVVLSDRGDLFRTVDSRVNVVNLRSIPDTRAPILSGIRSLYSFVAYLRKRSPDGILSTLTGCNLLSVVAWSLAGRHGCLVLREATSLQNVASKARLFFMSVLYKRASYVVALTAIHAKQLEYRLSVPPHQLRVIGNPIDRSFSSNSVDDSADKEVERFGSYLLAVGRLIPAKDFKSLIIAYSLVSNPAEFPKLVILGDGPERQMLADLVHQLSLDGRVVLAGNQSGLDHWYANAKGFVLTSLWEGYPNALLEALYYQLPVSVSVYDESIVEIIEKLEVENVSFSKPGNPGDIALSLEKLVTLERNVGVCLDSDPIVDAYEQLLACQ